MTLNGPTAVQSQHSGTPTPHVAPLARIVIADADLGFMTKMQDYLTAQSGYKVVARVESCMDALVWCEELSPDILILDWHLMFEGLLPTEMKGAALLQRIKALKNPPAVIVASRLSLDEHRRTALNAGADEFMPKTKFPQLVRPMIQGFLKATPRPA